jgi:hypothetical protein
VTLKTLLGIVLLVDAYIIVYYRLLVRYHYEKATGRQESTFGALFSFPPYKILPPAGRSYAQRYWIAIGLLVVCMAVLASVTELPPLFG